MSRSYRKTLLSFVAVALAPLILMGSVLALFIYSNVTEELRKSNAGTLSQIAASGDIILGELDSTFLTLATNSELTFLLADVLKTGTTSYYDALLYRTMKAFLYSQTNSRDYIHSIYISIDDCGQRIFSSLDGVAETASFYDAAWMDGVEFPEGSSLALRSRSIPASGSTPATQVVSIYRKFSLDTPGRTGTIVLNLNKRYLDNMLRSPGVRGSSGILAEYGGEALFESASATAQRWEPHLAALEQYGESFFDYSLEGEKYIISRSYAGQYGICYYMFTKADELYTVPYTIIRLIAACALVLVALSSLVLLYLSRRQYARLDHIIGILREESDKQQVPMPAKNYDEFEYIARRIQDNYLLQKYFETELSEKAYKQKYTELTALQAQINPHMLYNTLETIRWKLYALTDGYNEVVMMLETLSALLKYSLNPAASMVSLGEEIDNTVNYIRLVKLRYPEQFQIVWQYSEDVMDYATMRLILQPVIENAIHHGARQSTGGTTYIKIRISRFRGMIKVRILNTGAGMTPPQLAQVRSTLELDFAPAKGMGLFNINKRLQLQYGTQLSIRSRPAHGTVVVFSFPAQRYEPPQPD